MQTRLNLPAWLGVGEALAEQLQQSPEILADMHEHWYILLRSGAEILDSLVIVNTRPWFRTLIDLVEMILVKSELNIASNYDKQLVYATSVPDHR